MTLFPSLSLVAEHWPHTPGPAYVCWIAPNQRRRRFAWKTIPTGSAHTLLSFQIWIPHLEALASELFACFDMLGINQGVYLVAKPGTRHDFTFGFPSTEPDTPGYQSVTLSTGLDALHTVAQALANHPYTKGDPTWVGMYTSSRVYEMGARDARAAMALTSILDTHQPHQPNKTLPNVFERCAVTPYSVLPHPFSCEGFDQLRVSVRRAHRQFQSYFQGEDFPVALPEISVAMVPLTPVHKKAEPPVGIDFPQISEKCLPHLSHNQHDSLYECGAALLDIVATFADLPGLASSSTRLTFTLVLLEDDAELVVTVESGSLEKQLFCGCVKTFIRDWTEIGKRLVALDAPTAVYRINRSHLRDYLVVSGANASEAHVAATVLGILNGSHREIWRVPKLLEAHPSLATKTEDA